ncbi:MAG: cysteine desulfurase family protein [Bacteroidota bacterium]|jgi:cysteine desulfurase|nr:cysteine desulfurase family protein [Bacteroidota bacterium]
MMYLDHAATTPVDPRVLEAMLPFLREDFGNPSSAHAHGRRVRAAIEHARGQVAALIGAVPAEIIFTSGGTESDNASVRIGCALARDAQREIITSPAEHHAVLAACEAREARGFVSHFLPVDAAAVPLTEALEERAGPGTALVSLMHVNNETGGILPLADIAALLRSRGVCFHTDAVQSAGKMPIDVHDLGVDLLSCSAHKIHGPKGVGALYVRGGLRVPSLQLGGGQERGRRGGTENVTGIVGFGAAAEFALAEMRQRMQRWTQLRHDAEQALAEAFPALRFNGRGDRVQPNILSVTFPADAYPLDGGALLMNCDMAGLAVSGGSACTAGSIEPSHVIRAIGHADAEHAATIRMSFGSETTAADVHAGVEILIREVKTMLSRGN